MEKNIDIDPNRQRIGQRIAELRKEKGYSQAKLAELTGFAPGNIARVELGRYSTGIDILSKIASALDARLDIVKNDTTTGEDIATQENDLVEIEKHWHHPTDKIAATYDQVHYILELIHQLGKEYCKWEFSSVTNAQRSLTKNDASRIIDALLARQKVIIR